MRDASSRLLLSASLLAQSCFGLNLGINLAGNAYYGNVAYYHDVFMQSAGNAGPWEVNDNSGKVSLVDATGAPIATPLASGGNSTSVWTGFTQYFPAGNYTLSWTGTGHFQFSVGHLYPTNSTMDKDGNQHNLATLWLPGPPANAGLGDNSWVYVTVALPVTNCHLLSPPQFAVPNSVFRSDYLDTIKPFSTYRFMDLLGTNGNGVQNWSQRTLPIGSRVGIIQGIAYEDIVDLARVTGKDVWINIPSHATDDYVCRVARFFALGELGPTSNPDAPCNPSAAKTAPFTPAPTISSNQTIYLEFSNEVWNSGFSQWQDILCMANRGQTGGCNFNASLSAIAVAALANTSLPWTATADNKWGRAQQLTFVLAKRCVDIFRAAFAVAGPSAPRLHTTLNVQAGYYNCYYYAYPFFEQGFGPLNHTFNSFAIAPYLDVPSDNYTSSIDSIFSGLEISLNATIVSLSDTLSFFNSKGLKMIAYEGGQGLSGATNVDMKVAAQFDPRMFTITQKYFAAWESIVGPHALFNYYSYASGFGIYGSWGALSSSFVHGSQKYDALVDLLVQPGDATLDGRVDQSDCLAMAAAYSTSASAPINSSMWTRWFRDGDFNHDGCVNADDLALLNAHVAADLKAFAPICVANGSGLSVALPPSKAPTSTSAPTPATANSALSNAPTLFAVVIAFTAFFSP